MSKYLITKFLFNLTHLEHIDKIATNDENIAPIRNLLKRPYSPTQAIQETSSPSDG